LSPPWLTEVVVEHNAKAACFLVFLLPSFGTCSLQPAKLLLQLGSFLGIRFVFSKLQAFAAGHFLNHVMPSREMILQQDTPAVYAGEAPPHRATNWFLFQYMSSSEFQQGFRRAEVSSMAWHFTCSNLPAHVLALSMDHRWAGCT